MTWPTGLDRLEMESGQVSGTYVIAAGTNVYETIREVTA